MVFCIYYVLLITGCLVKALRDVKVTVPMAVRKGDSVVLHCHYDLEGDPLYSIKWYKGRAEFYRFTPNENPQRKLFPIPGLSDIHIDKTKSNETQLFLRSVTPSLSGQYNCEVSADAPSFHTAIVASDMIVVEVPLQPPSLTGVHPKYRVKDVMRANCTASPSRPAVNLTWDINGELVNPRLVKQYRQVPQKYPELEQSISILEVLLRARHFTSRGRLKVRCTASLYDLYWHTTETTTEREGQGDTAADNPGGGGESDRWDEYDDDYKDFRENVIIEDFPNPSSSEQVFFSAHSSLSPGLFNLAVSASCLLLATTSI